MLKCRKIALFLLLSTLFSSMAIATPSQLNGSFQDAVNNYLTTNKASAGISAVQLSVMLPGETQPQDYVAGTQSLSGTVPATTDMLFQWGSVTKAYTSALVLQLIDQGVVVNGQPLQLTDTLMQLFPEKFTQQNSDAWPQAWAGVTVIELMNMTAGTQSYDATPEFIKLADFNREYTLTGLVNIAAQYQRENGCLVDIGCFPVGSTWSYSNTNYILLGLIVEKATGMSFENAMNQNILLPLQNQGNRIYYYASKYPVDILGNMVHGYYYSQPTNPTDVTHYNMSWASSAGAMLGNMHGLAKLTQTFFTTNSIIPEGELEQNVVEQSEGAVQPVTEPATQCVANTCYAMGVDLLYDINQGGMVWFYEGSTNGYQSLYMWIPSENVVITVAQNSTMPPPSLLFTFAKQINTMLREQLRS